MVFEIERIYVYRHNCTASTSALLCLLSLHIGIVYRYIFVLHIGMVIGLNLIVGQRCIFVRRLHYIWSALQNISLS